MVIAPSPTTPVQVSSTQSLIATQRQFFNSHATQSYDFRIAQLQKLQAAIKTDEDKILEALYLDLHKPKFEAVAAELIFNLEEITDAIKHLKQWMRPKRVNAPLSQLPASAKIMPEPLGVVLIIGPWNYPFQLMIGPLVGAIAAGNCAILKPSELAPHTSAVIQELIAATFDPEFITVVEGDKTATQDLLQHRFDHIFFTGGTAVGKIIMRAAAEHLTPVTLELGGKSPCIVEPDTHLDYTARRIAWGKFMNAGQTCIAPDYLLVHETLKTELLEKIQEYVREFYGDDPAQSEDYCRIISDRHFERLSQLIKTGQVLLGGQTIAAERYIAPTVLDNVSWDDPVMADEIFGPILPVLTYRHLDEAIAAINARPKPLALYLFSQNKATQTQVLESTSSGGVCLNDTIMHGGVTTLPFGGVGESGIGVYHGKASFETFSHYKSVLNRSFLFDLKLRYPPYADKLKWVKLLLS
ncbi:MAG: aldehyde dehydrogenase [Spirulina sp. SIO3F2]|nr:aldehyde dehydrogenase [Spirulina sp. SIO3F2]